MWKIDISNLVLPRISSVAGSGPAGPTGSPRVSAPLPLGFSSTCAANDNGLFSQAFAIRRGMATRGKEPATGWDALKAAPAAEKIRQEISGSARNPETEDELSAFNERIAELEDEGHQAMRWKY